MITASQRAMVALVWAGIGPARMKVLLEEHGTPEAVLAAGPRAWGVRHRPDWAPPPLSLEEELALLERERVRLITLADADYPASLHTLPDPPPLLYLRGAWLPEDAAAVAIVGARLATPHGVLTAERLGRELAAHGITVVSGLALGIDGAAHRGALAAGGRTIAVLGHGLMHLFPSEHAALAAQIAAHGALLSEFPMTMPAHKDHFPRRNRIISGLSMGVVVVEAAAHSGALITARFALEQGREVFAVPGPAGSAMSRGTHQLLRDGAHLAESAEDVLLELHAPLAACLPPSPMGARAAVSAPPRLTVEEAQVYACLTHEPSDVDGLTAQTGVAPAHLLPVLLQLELKGLVRQVAGQQFVRVAP